jgi:NAD(P)-dependent dehydrogenase (short-subunit alcohol dehydrogenase family)
VILVAHDKARGETTVAEIEAATGNRDISLLVADLALQSSIRAAVGEFKRRYDRLHVLINNAAVNLSTFSRTVADIETVFAVNHLASFLLTNLLLDVLKASALARIVNVTSAGYARSIDFDNLQGCWGR